MKSAEIGIWTLLTALGLTVYDPKAVGFVALVLMVLSMSLPAFYFSYRAGYVQGKKELLYKLTEVIEMINEANEVALWINDAFGDIKPLEDISPRA